MGTKKVNEVCVTITGRTRDSSVIAVEVAGNLVAGMAGVLVKEVWACQAGVSGNKVEGDFVQAAKVRSEKAAGFNTAVSKNMSRYHMDGAKMTLTGIGNR